MEIFLAFCEWINMNYSRCNKQFKTIGHHKNAAHKTCIIAIEQHFYLTIDQMTKHQQKKHIVFELISFFLLK